VLVQMHASGSLIGTHELPPSMTDRAFDETRQLAAVSGHVVVGSGPNLVVRFPDGKLRHFETKQPVHAIVPSPRYTHPRVLVAQDEGLLLVDVLASGSGVVDVGMDLQRPVVGFGGHGTIVAVSADVGRVYDVEGTRIGGRAEFTTPVPGPFAIVPCLDAGRVAVVGAHKIAIVQLGPN
jgi:hypothetical protein